MPWWVQVYFDVSHAISEKSIFDTDEINKYFPENSLFFDYKYE